MKPIAAFAFLLAVLITFFGAKVAGAQGKPKVLTAEAYPGKPFGIGKIVFRIPASDLLIAETGGLQITEADSRIYYPVSSGGFLGRLLGGGEPNPEMRNTIWFLFRGDAPLKIQLHSGGTQSLELKPETPRRRIIQNQCWRSWWREYNKAFQNNDDYPLAFEVYLTSMLSERLNLPPTARSLRNQNPNQLQQTVDLMFAFESVRARTIQDMMHGGVARQTTDLAMPTPCDWEACPVAAPDVKPKMEPLADCVPAECFYVRFGSWGNQVWLKKLMAEYGGDMSRMIQLRGYEFPGAANMLDQLVLESSDLDDMFGGNVVADVAFVGTDFYVNDGGAIGVMFESKGKLFKNSLISKRKAIARKNEDATLSDMEINDVQATILRTPDNRYRSILISHDNIHLVTNCLAIAERFVEAANGKNRLSDHPEFQHARLIYPLERDDTLFAYFSADFFQQLLSPQYQIELRRRSSLMAEVQMFQLAAMIAENEGLAANDVDQWIEHGLLPENFGYRVDGSKISHRDGTYFDSLRGRRGYFAPIPDMSIEEVTTEESEWYAERRAYYEKHLKRFDPLFGTVKRFELPKGKERLVIDARLAPFGKDKYGWLASVLGEPNQTEIKFSPNDIIRFQASIQGGMMFPNIEPHQVFAAVQNDSIPETDLRPTSILDLFKTLKTTPGYLGAYPKPGYLDVLPQLGGQPDESGFTYSRLLQLWRLQFDHFSLLSFERPRLEEARTHLAVAGADRNAQLRLEVGDLRDSKLVDWVNSLNFQRSWQTSITNVRLMNMLISQFGVEPDQAKGIAESVLGVRLVCNLGGPYSIAKTNDGRHIWQSDSWPSFNNPNVPEDYMAPMLGWFRGARIELKQQQGQFVVYGWIDIQRKQAERPKLALPDFKVFKGFGKVEELPKTKGKDKDKKKPSEKDDK